MEAHRTRLVPIDGLRGIAIGLVLLAHIHQAMGYPFIGNDAVFASVDFLRSGVDLFFVLSGFCLFYPLTNRDATFDLRRFYARRARRLLPPYYAALGCILLTPFVLNPIGTHLNLATAAYKLPPWHSIWTHLLLVHTLFFDTFYDIDSPLWSLGIEVQFYLAFPMAVWLVARMGWRGIAVIAAITLAYRILATSPAVVLSPLPLDTADLFPSRWLEFGAGMLVAILARKAGEADDSRRHELFDLGGTLTLYLLGAFYLYGSAGNWGYPHKDLLFSSCWAILVYLACLPGSHMARVLAQPGLVWLGTVSYSVYLIHFPIIFAIAPSITALHLSNLANLLLLAAVALPIVLSTSAIFFYLFERPFLNTVPSRLVPNPGPTSWSERISRLGPLDRGR